MTTLQNVTWRQKLHAGWKVWLTCMRQLGPVVGTVSLLAAVIWILINPDTEPAAAKIASKLAEKERGEQ